MGPYIGTIGGQAGWDRWAGGPIRRYNRWAGGVG